MSDQEKKKYESYDEKIVINDIHVYIKSGELLKKFTVLISKIY